MKKIPRFLSAILIENSIRIQFLLCNNNIDVLRVINLAVLRTVPKKNKTCYFEKFLYNINEDLLFIAVCLVIISQSAIMERVGIHVF